MAFTDDRFTAPPRRDWHTVEVEEIHGGDSALSLGKIFVLVDGKRCDSSRFPVRTGFAGVCLAIGYMATRYVGRVD